MEHDRKNDIKYYQIFVVDIASLSIVLLLEKCNFLIFFQNNIVVRMILWLFKKVRQSMLSNQIILHKHLVINIMKYTIISS